MSGFDIQQLYWHVVLTFVFIHQKKANSKSKNCISASQEICYTHFWVINLKAIYYNFVESVHFSWSILDSVSFIVLFDNVFKGEHEPGRKAIHLYICRPSNSQIKPMECVKRFIIQESKLALLAEEPTFQNTSRTAMSFTTCLGRNFENIVYIFLVTFGLH